MDSPLTQMLALALWRLNPEDAISGVMLGRGSLGKVGTQEARAKKPETAKTMRAFTCANVKGLLYILK